MAVSMTDIFEEMKQRALRGEAPEPLDPELAKSVEDSETFGQCIKHPLYYHMIYAPEFAPMCNAQFRAKREQVRKLLDARRLEAVLWFYERPYRLRTFLHLDDTAWNRQGGIGFTPKLYWETLGSLWVDTENMWQDYGLWHKALHDERPCRWAIMDKDEREALKRWRKGKSPMLIHRGFAHDGPDRGFSWTLSKSRAQWFAERYAGAEGCTDPTLVSAMVDADRVIAHFTGRGEDEIVVLPEDVHVIRATRL